MATAIQQAGFKRVKRGYKPLSVDNLVPLYEIKNLMNPASKDPTDPFFKYQWYLKNVGQNGGKPKLDLNVEAAWAQGVTGKNVTTAIMDDGTSENVVCHSFFSFLSRMNRNFQIRDYFENKTALNYMRPRVQFEETDEL